MTTTIPITSLSPSEPPPPSKSIRGIVTLSWPYSSSTRQCALLLSDPDFRLRNRKGQVRIRFTGVSAEAVAKSRVGIGDELVVNLDGGSWEEDKEATRTPGRSVDGELMFRRKLTLTIVRSSDNLEVSVDAPVSPSQSPLKPGQDIATPLPKCVSALHEGLDGVVESLPSYTYTSPAFVKRLRLSSEEWLESAYDPFSGEDLSLQNGDDRPRTSFGSNMQWRYAEKTPSPTKATFAESLERPKSGESPSRVQAEKTKMLPPPLPQLQVPPTRPSAKQVQVSDDQDGPLTPKLLPVNSPTLPLPSPFPKDVGQTPYEGLPGSVTAAQGQDRPFEVESTPLEQGTTVREQQMRPDEDQDEQMVDESVASEPIIVHEYMSDTEEDTEPDEESSQRVNVSADAVHVVGDDIVGQEDEEDILNVQAEEGLDDELLIPGREVTADEVIIQRLDEEHISNVPNIVTNEQQPEPPAPPTSHLLPSEPRTPTRVKEFPSELSLDGATSAPASAHVTPQSEKDRIMAQTYRSLFGFGSAPAAATAEVSHPHLERQHGEDEEVESPLSKSRLLERATERLEAADEAQEPATPTRKNGQSGLPEPFQQERAIETSKTEDNRIDPAQVDPPEKSEPDSSEPLNGMSEMTRQRLEEGGVLPQIGHKPALGVEMVKSTSENEDSGIAEVGESSTQVNQPPTSPAPHLQVEAADIDPSPESEEKEEHVNSDGAALNDAALGNADLDVTMTYEEASADTAPRRARPYGAPLAVAMLGDAVLENVIIEDAALHHHTIENAMSEDAAPKDNAFEAKSPYTGRSDIAIAGFNGQRAPSDQFEATGSGSSGIEVSSPLSSPPEQIISPIAADYIRTAVRRSPQIEESTTPPPTATPVAIDLVSSPLIAQHDTGHPDDQTPKAADTVDWRRWIASPEIQDSLEDTETEDLMDPKHRTEDSTPRHEPLYERGTAPQPDKVSTSSPVLMVDEQSAQTVDHSSDIAIAESIRQRMRSDQIEATGSDSSRIGASLPLSSPPEHLTGSPSAAERDTTAMTHKAQTEKSTTPQPTATPPVIDPVSSPIAQPDINHAEEKSSTPAGLEEVIRNDQFGQADTALQSAGEDQMAVESPNLKVQLINEGALAESQAQETQVQDVQRPSYPSLPITPSNSQSLQDIPSQTITEPGGPETMHSMLPPTPQLTQNESSSHLQQYVNEHPVATVQDANDVGTLVQERPEVEHVPMSEVKKPARKSVNARVSNVPDVISAWFSPRRSSGVVAEDTSEKANKIAEALHNEPYAKTEAQQTNGISHTPTHGHALTHLEHVHPNGLSTSLSYFTPLSRLEEFINPSSQQTFGTSVFDVFAVVTHQTKDPSRAIAGPRDYFTIFRVSDSSLPAQASIRVEVFRPWLATLPIAKEADVILLRGFVVKSRKRQAYLLSTDASAWCVWRYEDATTTSDKRQKPTWALKAGSGNNRAVREEIKGPPVELGDEERDHARQLRLWWETVSRETNMNEVLDANDDLGMNGHVTQQVAAKL